MAVNNQYEIIKSVYFSGTTGLDPMLYGTPNNLYQYFNAVYDPTLPALRINILNGDDYWLPITGGTIYGDLNVTGNTSTYQLDVIIINGSYFSGYSFDGTIISGDIISGNSVYSQIYYSGGTNLLEIIHNVAENYFNSLTATSITRIELTEYYTNPQETLYVYQEVDLPANLQIYVSRKQEIYTPPPRIITISGYCQTFKCMIDRICGSLKGQNYLSHPPAYHKCVKCLKDYIASFPEGIAKKDITKENCGCNPKVPKKKLDTPRVIKSSMTIKRK